MNRWPTLILLALIAAGLIVAESRADEPTVELAASGPSGGPVSAAEGASGSTWYCAAGFTTPDGTNDHIVTITNQSDANVTGSVTLYPSLFDTLGDPVVFERAVQPLEVEANGQQRISLAPLVASLDELLATNTGAFVGALVEFDGAGVTVEHTVKAPQGLDTGPCATSAGARWWFASGTTTADVRYLLYLLNPFPDDAVVDISFVTDGGARNPTSFDGRLVPAQSLTVLDVTPVVPVWEQVTAEVSTRTGRLIAERIQLFDNEAGPRGLSLSLGANQLTDQWFFPAGRAVPGAGESYLIFNPGDQTAEVEFELKPDSADRVGDVAPLQIAVGPRERWIVNVSTHEFHPVGAVASVDATRTVEPDDRFFASVRSFNGVPIIAERVITLPRADGSGVASSLGITVASTDQMLMVPLAVSPEVEDDEAAPTRPTGTLAVLNPAGNTIARVQILVDGPDGQQLRAEVELAPRRRAAFSLDSLGITDEQWIIVRSSKGVMAELITVSDDGVVSTAAVPTDGTTSRPDLLAFD